MIDIKTLRERIREVSLNEESKETVTSQGDTLDDALMAAAAEFNVPKSHIEYEILQNGSSGLFNLGKHPFIIRANVVAKEVLEEHAPVSESNTEIQNDDQGSIHVKLDGSSNILLRITKPTTKNKNITPITPNQVFRFIVQRTLASVDENLVYHTIKRASGKFVRIGEYTHNFMNDAKINCIISEDEMKAEIHVSPPGIDGMDVTYGQILAVLKENEISYGIETEKLKAYSELPSYNTLILAAKGKPAIPGKNAEIVYKYEKEQKPPTTIDYKEITQLPNVRAGDLLAEKTDPGKSIAGTSVRGRYVMQADGHDITIKTGSHVSLSADGKQAYADLDGLVRVTREGVISVDPIYVINGDVSIKTGHIRFLGTVIIRGNVEDGFMVVAKANINVYGLVGKSILRAGGSIVVHRGVAGKGGAKIIADEHIKTRFIENSYVECGNTLAVSDGIINSTVLVQNNVICRGKRANIIAGHVMARNYIDVKNVGGSSGTRTVIEVGYDPKTLLHLRKLNDQKKTLLRELDTVKLNINTLLVFIKRLRDASTAIPPERQEQARELAEKKRELIDKLSTVDTSLHQVEVEIGKQRESDPQISVARKIHSGTRIIVLNKSYNVRKEFSALTFYLEDDIIQMKAYAEPKIAIPEV